MKHKKITKNPQKLAKALCAADRLLLLGIRLQQTAAVFFLWCFFFAEGFFAAVGGFLRKRAVLNAKNGEKHKCSTWNMASAGFAAPMVCGQEGCRLLTFLAVLWRLSGRVLGAFGVFFSVHRVLFGTLRVFCGFFAFFCVSTASYACFCGFLCVFCGFAPRFRRALARFGGAFGEIWRCAGVFCSFLLLFCVFCFCFT